MKGQQKRSFENEKTTQITHHTPLTVQIASSFTSLPTPTPSWEARPRRMETEVGAPHSNAQVTRTHPWASDLPAEPGARGGAGWTPGRVSQARSSGNSEPGASAGPWGGPRHPPLRLFPRRRVGA